MVWDLKKVLTLKLPKLLRECFAELLGMYVIIFFGDGSVAQSITQKENNLLEIHTSWAGAVFLGVLISSDISGAHLNPVITICLFLTHNFPPLKVFLYIVSQCLGGFLGAATVYYIYKPSILNIDPNLSVPLAFGQLSVTPTANIFSTFPKPYLTIEEAIVTEIFATFMLTFVIYFIIEKMGQSSLLSKASIVAITVLLIGSSFGSQTGYAINPARDFGPRLFSSIIYGKSVFTVGNAYFWVPIIAPIMGGLFAIVVYYFFLGFNSAET